MITAIREFLYKRRLISQKLRAIFEIEQDLKYLAFHKKTMLEYDEAKARKRMVELKKIESRSPVEEAELDAVLSVIAESKAVKNEYEKSKAVLEDCKGYVKMLRCR